MSEPKVSIIIPNYNAAAHIVDCVKSLLQQTYSNLEILIINDGSTDNSVELLEEAFGQNVKLKIFNNKNHGPSYSRNYGVDKATGSYIIFVDADDLLHPQRIEVALKHVSENRVVITGHRKFVTNDELETNLSTDYLHSKRESQESTALRIAQNTHKFGLWSLMLTPKVFKDIGKINEDLINAEDTEFIFRFLTRSIEYFYVDAPLYFYRNHDNPARLTQSGASVKIKRIMKAFMAMKASLPKIKDIGLKEIATRTVAKGIARRSMGLAIAGDESYKSYLKDAKAMHSSTKPYAKPYANFLSGLFGYGRIEYFVAKIKSKKEVD